MENRRWLVIRSKTPVFVRDLVIHELRVPESEDPRERIRIRRIRKDGHGNVSIDASNVDPYVIGDSRMLQIRDVVVLDDLSLGIEFPADLAVGEFSTHGQKKWRGVEFSDDPYSGREVFPAVTISTETRS